MMSRPHTPTLFPYTTLFRSLWRVWAAAGVAERWQQQAGGKDLAARQANRSLDAVITLFQTAERFVGQHSGDRKSTRLNSSHVAISYAVFCLKKKRQLSTI